MTVASFASLLWLTGLLCFYIYYYSILDESVRYKYRKIIENELIAQPNSVLSVLT